MRSALIAPIYVREIQVIPNRFAEVFIDDVTYTVIHEPSTLALAGMGPTALFAYRWRLRLSIWMTWSTIMPRARSMCLSMRVVH